MRAGSTCSTRRARWSPRCTSRVAKMREQGREIVMIGHAGHPEVEGTMGQLRRRHVPGRDARMSTTSQSRDPRRSPTSRKPRFRSTTRGDHRRAEARAFRRSSARRRTTSAMRRRIARTRSSPCRTQVDVVIVVGCPNSSNSNRLREVAAHRGVAGVHGRSRRRAPARMDRRRARASASPPARRRPRCWCARWSTS